MIPSLELNGHSGGQTDADGGAQRAEIRDLLVHAALEQEAESAASEGRHTIQRQGEIRQIRRQHRARRERQTINLRYLFRNSRPWSDADHQQTVSVGPGAIIITALQARHSPDSQRQFRSCYNAVHYCTSGSSRRLGGGEVTVPVPGDMLTDGSMPGYPKN